MDEWLWLCSLPGFYRKDLERLIQYFETPDKVWRAEDSQFSVLPFLKEKQKETLKEWKKQKPSQIRNKMKKGGIKFISCTEENYPQKLLTMPDYPFGLFYLGEIPKEQERCVAVVGARMCTNYGRTIAAQIAETLAEAQIAVVSGMAYGIDGIAQAACLQKKGRSYAVTGCGPDICYPRDHRALYLELEKNGGIISEFAPGTQAQPFHFPMRNRLISGLCEAVIVVEARKKSGSLITADLALEQGRDVLVIPGRVSDPLSEGCNQLISQGAAIVTSLEDLQEQLGIVQEKTKKNKKNNIKLASSENMVYICLDFRPKSLSEIAGSVQMAPEEVMRILAELQIRGLVEEIAKNYYVLKK